MSQQCDQDLIQKILLGIKEIWSWHKIELKLTVFICDSDLSPAGSVMSYAYHLTVANFDQSLMKILPGVKEIWRKHEIERSNWQPSVVIMTFSRHGWMKGSAHHFTEANIWPKFNEYLSPSKGDIIQTRISRLKLLTFSCELDLESPWLGYAFCTSAR